MLKSNCRGIMKKAAETYTTIEGNIINGVEGRIMAALDAHNPLLNIEDATLNDIQSLNELRLSGQDCWWCADTNSLIVPTGLGNYYESKGDRLLYERVTTFNEVRHAWALDQAAHAQKVEDKQLLKAVKVYDAYVKRANSASQIASFVRLFKSMNEISACELNVRGDIIGTPDGVVDLDKAALVADFDDSLGSQWKITKRTNACIDSRQNPTFIRDERWEQFIDEIMCGDKEMSDFLKRALGYSILGGNPEECMFIAYGASTRNGKGTLLNTVMNALGDYSAAMSSDFLLAKRAGSSGGTDDALASLAGKRLVSTSEPKKGARLDESKLKSLTGNDPITTSHKFGRTFTFKPEFTIWLSCNNLPTVEDDSIFSSNRIYVIPFERHFDKSEQDVHLKEKFASKDVLDTVFEWLIEGYIDYKETGLNPPAKVIEATRTYDNASSAGVARFIRECATLKVNSRTSNNTLRAAYTKWCDDTGEEPLTAYRLRAELATFGVSKGRSNGRDYWQGIELSNDILDILTKNSPESKKGAIHISG